MKFNNMTVRAKLTAAFGTLALLVLLVAGLSLKSLNDANERFSSYVNGINARANLATHVRTAVDRRAIAARNLVLVTRPTDVEVEKAAVIQAHEDVQNTLAKLNDMLNNSDSPEAAKRLVADISKVEQKYGPIALTIVDLALHQKQAESIAKMNDECRPQLAALIKASDDYAAYTADQAQALTRAAAAAYSNQRAYLLLACLTALLAAASAGFWITRSLTRALGAEPGQVSEAVQRVADGSLGTPVKLRAGDTTSTMAAVQRMQQSLSGIVHSVRGNSESVATASAQIAQGNADLSQRTEEQASALQQTAATMDELSSTVRNNTENAKQANQLALGASNVAIQGGEVVENVVQTMKAINDSSKKITDIIAVIDGIAFQTNILALNAAVEAARAGEQGRGFAVVASEVRNLAQRSASAAKEIKTLITGSVEQVSQGTALVDQAGKTMQEIVESIKKVSDIVGEISSASVEQSAGVAQAGLAINQMDQVTQQNAALVEESAAAAESLKLQAQLLVQAVSVFKLTHDE